MSRQLLFATFSDANSFLKKIRVGKIQRKPNTDLYIWDSEHAILNNEHKSIIEEMDGSKFVWKDHGIGLTWLFKNAGFLDLERWNATNYGGHDDWRTPTISELKTLSSNVKNSFGCYVKFDLENRVSGNYRSCTPYLFGVDKAWWNFDKGCATTEQYTEGNIRWGVEGEYAGFDKDEYHNYAKSIFVRGEETHLLSDWAIRLRAWTEVDNVFDFPVTQRNIEEIENLTLYYSKSLPAEISRLPKLKRLTCRSEAGIENALFSIAGLEELELLGPTHKGPRLEEIPASVRTLRNLASLKATMIGLKKVSEEIGSLEKLQNLDLGYNEIELVPNSIGDLGELRSLSLCPNKIRVVPNSIGQLKKLEKLSIGGHFDHLPESIGSLDCLQDLIIRSSKLTEIPKSFCNLPELQRLICEAPLKRFHIQLDSLKKLKLIVIENALLESIPNDLFTMSWLQKLRIIKTPIERIPDKIAAMTSLEELDLSGTQIAELPKSLLLMENLRSLNVSNTKIDFLPEWLCDMKSLSKISGASLKKI